MGVEPIIDPNSAVISDEEFIEEEEADEFSDTRSDAQSVSLYSLQGGDRSHYTRIYKPGCTHFRRRRWTQRDMTNAFNAVKYQGMSLRGAAVSYNVPESTLRDRVHGRVSLECPRPGPPTFFTCEEEKRMVDHILFMSKIGYPYTRIQVVELAGDMTKAVGRIAPFKYLNPSQAWFYAFLNRWPDLKNFLFGPRNNRKARGVSGDSIQSYYELLDKVLVKYDIKDKPDHVWVMDELSISCENQPPKVIPINIQRAQSTSYWTPSISILGAASAAGEKLPAFMFYRGDSITGSMMTGSVKGTKFSTTNSGWLNSDSYILWFMHHFRQKVNQRPILLLYDGHLQFISVRVLEKARDYGFLLFPLPPHPAYNHCVENTCFSQFQFCFDRRLERYLERHLRQPLTKQNIAPVITAAYERALKPGRVTQLFQRLGVCPFNNLSSSIGAYMSIPADLEPDYETETKEAQEKSEPTEEAAGGLYPAMMEHISKKYGMTRKRSVDSNGKPASASEALKNNIAAAAAAGSSASNIHSDRIQDYMGDRWAYFQKSLNRSIAGKWSTQASYNQASTILNSANAQQQQSTGSSKLPPNRVPSVEVCASKKACLVSNSSTPSSSVGQQQQQILDYEEQEPEEMDQRQSPAEALLQRQSPAEALLDEDSVEELEAGEGPDFCGICGHLEPPNMLESNSNSNGDDDTQVIDWTRCDYCYRWVHLNNVCSLGSVIKEESFMCRFCNQVDETGCRVETGSLHSSASSSKKRNSVANSETLEEEIITI